MSDQKLPTLMPVGDLISKTWSFFKTHYKKLISLLLLTYIPLFIIQALYMMLMTQNLSALSMMEEPIEPMLLWPFNGWFLIAFLVYIILVIIISVFAYVSCLTLINEPALDIKTALLKNKTLFAQALLATILNTVIVTLGFIALIIPGIILSIYLTFALPIVILENKKATDALKQSWYLVQGYWWSVVGRFLALALILIIISVLISGLVNFMFRNSIIDLILSMAVNFFATIFGFIYIYNIYQQLKQAKEATSSPVAENKP